MATQETYFIYQLGDRKELLLTPKTVGQSSLWKYKNLWFRRFYNEDIEFSILAEQRDIGDCYVFGPSEALVQQLYDLGVVQRKDYHITAMEGSTDDPVNGRIYHLENDFTLEVKKDQSTGNFRYKVYPSEYNDMNQKRCLIRASFVTTPEEAALLPVKKVYEGPKENIPEAYQHLVAKKSAGCLGIIALLGLLTSLWAFF